MGRELAAAAAVALVLSGCGGAKHAAPPRPPALPHALASDLAAASDQVAAALATGDSCRALILVHGLQAQTIAAINAHRVPAGLQEQLSGAVNSLAARVSCVPPPDNRGKHNGHEKHGKKKKDEGD
jgi:hypothetical protein